jgi:hypothetical protein
MSKKISSFYEDELNSWIDSLKFYLNESRLLETSLEEIITRNTIIDIAAKVEVHQLILNKSVTKLKELETEVAKIKSELTSDDGLVEDKFISKEVENKIKVLALSFKHTEQEFIDVKYYCNEFLIEVLKKKE